MAAIPSSWAASLPLALAGPILGFFVAGLVLRRSPHWRRLGGGLLAGAALTLILVVVSFATFSVEAVSAGRGVAGLIERLLVVEIHAWYIALALATTKQNAPRKAYKGPPDRDRNARQAAVAVEFRQGNASEMPYPDASFDFVVCRAAFKNFSDPMGALNEIHRVLRPGGRASVLDLRRESSPQESSARRRDGACSAEFVLSTVGHSNT